MTNEVCFEVKISYFGFFLNVKKFTLLIGLEKSVSYARVDYLSQTSFVRVDSINKNLLLAMKKNGGIAAMKFNLTNKACFVYNLLRIRRVSGWNFTYAWPLIENRQ